MILILQIFIYTSDIRVQKTLFIHVFYNIFVLNKGRLCGLVVRVPGYRSEILGSIPAATRFSEK
jgi:hypothetical protein